MSEEYGMFSPRKHPGALRWIGMHPAHAQGDRTRRGTSEFRRSAFSVRGGPEFAPKVLLAGDRALPQVGDVSKVQ